MSNAAYVDVNFKLLMNLIEHIKNLQLSQDCYENTEDHIITGMIYERQALENLTGELDCVILEANKRIRYLENILSEHI